MRRKLPPVEAAADAERGPLNPSLPEKLQQRRLHYTGYLWQRQEGWLSASQLQRWCVLIGQELFLGVSPMDAEYQAASLVGAEVVDAAGDGGGRHTFTLKGSSLGDLTLWSESELEKLMWAVRLEVACFQANPDRQADAEARVMYGKIFTCYPERPVAPCFGPGSDLPERVYQPLAAGYLVTKTEDSWLGENWGRRYVTVHECWLSVRNEKRSPAGLRIIPLRGAELELESVPAEQKWRIAIDSPHTTGITVSSDSEEAFRKWSLSVEGAVHKANPEREVREGLREDLDAEQAAGAQAAEAH
eukprot:TRINITY_DN32634_c0_g1_i1.p1 TRINITY_DN32634_c0_g1~~TRINITY_DN32634_c0_g1_i1.p1  ORF type:complete len:302 (+),score=76.22 TRINITY_DN32634_c0_g1_i1:54-959(+)